MLNYKVLGADVLAFKNENDTLTICRGSLGEPIIDQIEINGEALDWFHDVHPFDREENTFTEEEVQYFINNYDEIVGPMY
jgi:hypothetical protein